MTSVAGYPSLVGLISVFNSDSEDGLKLLLELLVLMDGTAVLLICTLLGSWLGKFGSLEPSTPGLPGAPPA